METIASRRLQELFARVGSGFKNTQRDVLTQRERSDVQAWMNAEAFADRTREFEFQATAPNGQRGTFKTTINGLLLIEPSYDVAKRAIVARLAELERDGVISRQAPLVQIPAGLPLNGDWQGMLRNGLNVAFAPDTRLSTGFWGDFPPYGGASNAHLGQTYVLGFQNRASGPLLPNFPVPQQWTRYFPGPKFYERRGNIAGAPGPNGSTAWAFSDDAFVRILEEITTNIPLLVKGANGNIEFHPGVMAFNNGTQFPSPAFPPDLSAIAYDDVSGRHQYKADHKWAETTSGARGSATGLVINGRSDALWLHSMRVRQKLARCENHQMVFTNDWGKIEAADAAADFFRWINCASFLVEIGATSHVHACTEAHNAVANKATRETGGAAGNDLDLAVARERAARGERTRSRTDQLDAFVARLQLAADTENEAAGAAAGQILNGGLVASAQLFMANPIAGGVCAVVVGCVALFTYLFGGGLTERKTPEKCLVRDGKVRVRDKDEDDDPDGDVYGGNIYPWSRERAIRGIPVIRAKDAAGRTYE